MQRGVCTCKGASLAVQRVLCTSRQLAWTCKETFARSDFGEIQSIDYWFRESGITYPTLQIIKTLPKRRLLEDKNDVFWMRFGFKIFGGSTYRRHAAPRSMKASLTVQRLLCTSIARDDTAYHHSNQLHRSTSGQLSHSWDHNFWGQKLR